MHLYDSFGPNPRATRMFLAEKGITIPTQDCRSDGGGKSQAALHRSQSRRTTSRARTRQRQMYRRDRRDLGISRREASDARADRHHRRRTRRDAPVAAPRRAANHRASLQRVSLFRGRAAVQGSDAHPARGGARNEGGRAGQAQVARSAARGQAITSSAIASPSPTSFYIARSISAAASSSRSIRR